MALDAECLLSCLIGRVRCVLMKCPRYLTARLMWGATGFVSRIAREHRCYKGRVCTSAARGRLSVYPVAERRVQVSCRRDCWCVVPPLSALDQHLNFFQTRLATIPTRRFDSVSSLIFTTTHFRHRIHLSFQTHRQAPVQRGVPSVRR